MDADDQFRTPLFDAMVQLAESRKVSFHTPGHKSGKGISTRFRKFVGPKIFSIDLTTLDEVDSLQKPRGVIKEAQELAARAYGANHSFFLINGTSSGNHAMILSACRPGDKILIARNAHRSVLTGLILSGAKPVFFMPSVDEQLKLTLNVAFEEVKRTIDSNPDARSIFITSPNYYGICADIERIIAYAHERGLIVMVDEAHGPHLKFHPSLPIPALEADCDMCVQSTHKIIGGMTQASMIHVKGNRIDIELLKSVLRSVQTTSPSYILMASLDLARMQMATEGEKLLDKAIRLAEEARVKINRIPGISCFGREILLLLGVNDLDVTKLTITVSELGLTGYQISQILNQKYDIQVEMADPFHLLVIVSIGDRKDDLQRLIEALRDIAKNNGNGQKLPIEGVGLPLFTNNVALTPREAFFSERQFIPLRKVENRISSEIVTVYPPGIPILVPGEIVLEEVIDYLQRMLNLGAIVDGLSQDNSLIGVVSD